jgi:hypothetical protein
MHNNGIDMIAANCKPDQLPALKTQMRNRLAPGT